MIRVFSFPVAPPRCSDSQLLDFTPDGKGHPERRSEQRRLRCRIVPFRLVADRIVSINGSAIVPGSVERDRSAWRQHAHQVADRHPFTRIRQHLAFSAGRTEQISNDQVVKLAAQVDRSGFMVKRLILND